MTAQQEQAEAQHPLGMVFSTGAVSGMMPSLFAMAGKQSLHQTQFSSPKVGEFAAAPAVWGVCEQLLWCWGWWDSPGLGSQQCWAVTALRGGLDEPELLHMRCDKYWSPLRVLFWGHSAGRRLICIIPDSRPVNSSSSPTLMASISPTCFIEPVLMLFKVFANTLLRHCWYWLQLCASVYEITHYSCHWNLYNLESRGIWSFVLLCGNRSTSESLLWTRLSVLHICHFTFPDLDCKETTLPNVGVDSQDFHLSIPATASSVSKENVNLNLWVKPVHCPAFTTQRWNFANRFDTWEREERLNVFCIVAATMILTP